MGFWSTLAETLTLGLIADGSDGLGVRPPDPMDPRFWGAVETSTLAGQQVSARSVLQNDVVQSVLARISGTISTLPLMVFERLAEPDEDGAERRPAREHPLYDLLHSQPTVSPPVQTAQEWRQQLVFELAFWRNSYHEIVQGPDGEVAELIPIHNERVLNIERRAGRVYYTVRRLDGTGQDVYRDDEIMHIRMAPLTEDGLRGQYVWETARETFGRAQAVEAFGALYFRNGGSGGGTLEHPGHFKDKEEQSNFLETWRQGGSGLNRHRDRLLLYGVKYTPFSVKNDEAQFIDTLKEMAVKICRLWNFPPHMAGILDKATFSNIEQQSVEFVVYCIAPWVSALEQAFRRDLLIGPDDRKRYFLEFNVAGLLRGDWKSRYQGYAWGRQWGWLSANDVRRFENMNPIGAAGDVYLSPLNMTPAGQPGAEGGATADPNRPGEGEQEEQPAEDDED